MILSLGYLPWMFWASQFFGGLAVLFDIVKFTRKNRASLLLWGIPAGWSMVASQLCLGEPQGTVFQAMSSLETLLQVFSGQNTAAHRRRRIGLFLLFGGMGFWIYAPSALWWTWLPVGAYAFGSLGKVFHRTWLIRSVWLLSSACTFAYACEYGNWAMATQQVVVVGLTLAMLVRDWRGHQAVAAKALAETRA